MTRTLVSDPGPMSPFVTFKSSVDTDEMQLGHRGLTCLQKYSFRGFPNTKG